MDNSLRQKLETVFYEAGTPLDDKLLSECMFSSFSLDLGASLEYLFFRRLPLPNICFGSGDSSI